MQFQWGICRAFQIVYSLNVHKVIEQNVSMSNKKITSKLWILHGSSNLEKWPLLHKLWLNIDLIYLELMDFSWGTHRTFKILAKVGKKGIP